MLASSTALPSMTAATPDASAPPDGIRQRSYQAYLQRLADSPTARDWWSAVILTAGSHAQAELYREQIRHRAERGYWRPNGTWPMVADSAGSPEGRHIGSGGATLRALQVLGKSDPAWWNRHRVLVIHAGGESRRLPEYRSEE